MFQLRKGSIEDASALIALDALCFEPGIRYDEDTFHVILTHSEFDNRIVETKEKELAGFAAWEAGRYGHVITIDVSPDFRRQQVGSLLIQTIEESVREKGGIGVFLEVSDLNKVAISFYLHHNYRAFSKLRDYYGTGLNALLMIKSFSD